MSCKKCNTSPCFQGECGCTHKVDTECITYNGNSLACTSIPEGINLNDLIESLDQSICNTIGLIGSMVIENVGDGAGTFYQIGNTGIREFRSLNSINTNLSIVENVDQIDFTVPNSTDSQRGAIELATEAESNALIDTERAVTPATLPIASETQQGLAEIATQAEVDAGVDDQRYITPLKQGVYVNNTATTIVTNYVADPTNLPSASTTQEGVIEIATQAEVDAGVATNLAVVPSTLETYTTTYVNNYVSNPVNLPNATETQRGIAELATTTEVQTGTDVERIVTPAGLSSRTATETRTGILEVATQAEANALALDDKIITPAKLPISSTTQQGLAEIATQAEVDAGVDTVRYVTPATLSNYTGFNSNVRNVGYFTGFDVDIDPIGTTYTTSGDIVSATVDSKITDGDVVRVVFNNAMDNTDYMVRLHVESRGVLSDDNNVRYVVYKIVNSTTIDIVLEEIINSSQNIRVHIEAIQI